jgi:hypothetical protein
MKDWDAQIEVLCNEVSDRMNREPLAVDASDAEKAPRSKIFFSFSRNNFARPVLASLATLVLP